MASLTITRIAAMAEEGVPLAPALKTERDWREFRAYVRGLRAETRARRHQVKELLSRITASGDMEGALCTAMEALNEPEGSE
jgi:cytochrome P450